MLIAFRFINKTIVMWLRRSRGVRWKPRMYNVVHFSYPVRRCNRDEWIRLLHCDAVCFTIVHHSTLPTIRSNRLDTWNHSSFTDCNTSVYYEICLLYHVFYPVSHHNLWIDMLWSLSFFHSCIYFLWSISGWGVAWPLWFIVFSMLVWTQILCCHCGFNSQWMSCFQGC